MPIVYKGKVFGSFFIGNSNTTLINDGLKKKNYYKTLNGIKYFAHLIKSLLK